MKLRPATPDDVPAMFAIRTAVTENALTIEQLAAIGITPASVAESLRNQCRGWMAVDEAELPMGFAIADSQQQTVFALFVRPGYEGLGCGTALLREATAWLFARGATTVWLTTGPDTRAAAFYRRRGWRESGLTDGGELRFELDRPALP